MSTTLANSLTEPFADRIGLTDVEMAAALGVSLTWIRTDRRRRRLLPFYRIGGVIRYNPQHVLKVLDRLAEGGTPLKRKGAAA